jgi:hypothetical protein
MHVTREQSGVTQTQHLNLFRLAGRWNAGVHHLLFLLTNTRLSFLKASNNFFLLFLENKSCIHAQVTAVAVHDKV